MAIDTVEMIDAAKDLAGNWKHFESFGWSRSFELDDADNWAIIYTHHRDSGLLDLSNAQVMERALEPFTEGDDPDVVFERHDHFAVGYIDGFSIRVIKDGMPTEAFQHYHELAERLANYPILDEYDYSAREFEATLANIVEAAWKLRDEFELPEDWQSTVYEWLSEHRPGAIENRDDHGGYPSEDDLVAAFEDLGWERLE